MIRLIFFPRTCRKTICTLVDYNIRKHSRETSQNGNHSRKVICLLCHQSGISYSQLIPERPMSSTFCKYFSRTKSSTFSATPSIQTKEVRRTQIVESCVNLLVPESLCEKKSPPLKKTKLWTHCHLWHCVEDTRRKHVEDTCRGIGHVRPKGDVYRGGGYT